MPGRGKRVKGIAKTIIYNIYKYFKKKSAKSKYRGPLKLTRKTAEATGYGEQTVRQIIAEKTALSGAAFSLLFTLSAVKELTYKAFDQVIPEQWKKLIDHVRREFENRYWHDDGLQKEAID